MSDQEDKTRVTVIDERAMHQVQGEKRNDCLVVIYTKEATLLGKRFVLEQRVTRVGRGADSDIMLDGDSVSRRHCYFEQRQGIWYVIDDESTNGTFVNDDIIAKPYRLSNGDQIKVGPTIFKFLSGADVENQYHEEIYRMTIIDGLTQTYNKRFLFESLEKEIVRVRRHGRPLSVLMFDIDHFKDINDEFGHLAGDAVLKDLGRLVQDRIRRDEVVARYGGEEFVVVLPETELDGARILAENLRFQVQEAPFVFQADRIRVTISIGCATLVDQDRSALDLIKRADERLYDAKRGGRNRVCS